MKICLTGDVHHSGMKTKDLGFCKGSEIDAAVQWAEIAENYGLKSTLFLTGLCALEAPETIASLGKSELVEIGGHNYFAFQPRALYDWWGRITGNKNGPKIVQNWEVSATTQIIRKLTGKQVLSWRNHGYRHDDNTRAILIRNGITHFSDILDPELTLPCHFVKGLVELPINTLPDHDFVYHGARQRGMFDEAPLLSSKFRTGAVRPSRWLEIVKKQVLKMEGENNVATILAHPSCMAIIDEFDIFEDLCRFLSAYNSVNMSEIQVEHL